MSNKKALSLFDGGKKGVLSRMQGLIQERLSQKNSSFIKSLAEKTDCMFEEINTIVKHRDDEQIEQDHGRLVFKVFMRVESPLNISIHDALGLLSFKNGAKDYWQQQRKIENPIVFIGRTGKSAVSNINFSQEERDNKELDLYVRLRAIEELIEYIKVER